MSHVSANMCSNCKQYSYKTHDNQSLGQEEAGRTQQMSELFTHSNALKFANGLNESYYLASY